MLKIHSIDEVLLISFIIIMSSFCIYYDSEDSVMMLILISQIIDFVYSCSV